MAEYSFGAATFRFIPNGGTPSADTTVLGEQVDGTDTILTSEGDVANFFAKGING